MFLVFAGAGAIAGLVLFSTTLADVNLSGWAGSVEPWFAFGRRAIGVVSWIINFASMVIGSVSPLWLYGGACDDRRMLPFALRHQRDRLPLSLDPPMTGLLPQPHTPLVHET